MDENQQTEASPVCWSTLLEMPSKPGTFAFFIWEIAMLIFSSGMGLRSSSLSTGLFCEGAWTNLEAALCDWREVPSQGRSLLSSLLSTVPSAAWKVEAEAFDALLPSSLSSQTKEPPQPKLSAMAACLAASSARALH